MKKLFIIIFLTGCVGSKTEITQQDTLPEGIGVYGIMTGLPDSTKIDSNK